MKDCGLFHDRMKALNKKILHCLTEWSNLTPNERGNFYCNVKYATSVINRQASVKQVRLAGTVPFMQLQGYSNYCGVCALNNLMGKEVISVERMNNIADDLWLRQFEQLELSLTERLQCHRTLLDSTRYTQLKKLWSVMGTVYICCLAIQQLDLCLRHHQNQTLYFNS